MKRKFNIQPGQLFALISENRAGLNECTHLCRAMATTPKGEVRFWCITGGWESTLSQTGLRGYEASWVQPRGIDKYEPAYTSHSKYVWDMPIDQTHGFQGSWADYTRPMQWVDTQLEMPMWFLRFQHRIVQLIAPITNRWYALCEAKAAYRNYLDAFTPSKAPKVLPHTRDEDYLNDDLPF